MGMHATGKLREGKQNGVDIICLPDKCGTLALCRGNFVSVLNYKKSFDENTKKIVKNFLFVLYYWKGECHLMKIYL